jgi:DNA polymerase-3 subunit epsilon
MQPLTLLPADRAPTVVIDLEATSMASQDEARIIELAVIRVEGGEERAFSSLVDPGAPIPAEGRAIHNIDDAMVAGQPGFADAWRQAAPLVDGAVLVAHNAPSDLGLLHAECRRAHIPPPRPAVVIDTLELARTVFGLIHCNLPALAERAGVAHDQPHRALPDARATLGVYRAMLVALRPEGPPTVGELLELTESLARGGAGRKAINHALRAAWDSGRRVVIDYTSGAGGALSTRREITVTGIRPPYVDALCHLRDEPRVFKLTRIRRVLDSDSG